MCLCICVLLWSREISTRKSSVASVVKWDIRVLISRRFDDMRIEAVISMIPSVPCL